MSSYGMCAEGPKNFLDGMNLIWLPCFFLEPLRDSILSSSLTPSLKTSVWMVFSSSLNDLIEKYDDSALQAVSPTPTRLLL